MQIFPAAAPAAEGVQPAASRPEGLFRFKGGGGSLFESIMAASVSEYEPTVFGEGGEGEAVPGFFPAKKASGKAEINYSAIFSGLAFQPRLMPEATEVSDEQILEQCAQVIDSIVAVLEGNSPYTDMENLLQKLDVLMGELSTPLEQNNSELAQQITARMPQINAIERGDAPAKPETGLDAESSRPCPLENDNEPLTAFSQTARENARTDIGLKNAEQLEPQEQNLREPADKPAQAAPALLNANRAEKPDSARLAQQTEAEKLAEPTERAAPQALMADEQRETQSGEAKPQSEHSRQKNAAPVDFSAARPFDIAPMRAEAGIALENAAAPQPAQATQQTLLDTMVEQMTLNTADGASTVEIELRPDYLGKVSIELSLDQHGLQAKIRADDPGIKDLIGGQVNQLIESLSQKGVKVNELEVIYTGPQTQSFEQGGGEASAGQHRQGRGENRNRGLKGIEGSAFEIVDAQGAQALPDSATVQYRA